MLLWDHIGITFWLNTRDQLVGHGLHFKGTPQPQSSSVVFPPTGTSFLGYPVSPAFSSQPERQAESGKSLWDLSSQLEPVRLSLSSSQAVPALGDLR